MSCRSLLKGSLAMLVLASCLGLQALAKEVELPEGTLVQVRVKEKIKHDAHEKGEKMTFIIHEDVLAPDKETILIPRGSQATGIYEESEDCGRISGCKTIISVTVDEATSFNGKTIPLTMSPPETDRNIAQKTGGFAYNVAKKTKDLAFSPVTRFSSDDDHIDAGTVINTYVKEAMTFSVYDRPDDDKAPSNILDDN